jgi:cation diffusion facilitator family transporter
MTADERRRTRLSAGAVNLGLACNVVLAAVKTSIGVLGHSAALLADGINSTSDVAYYVVVKVFMALSRKPPDSEHPYGHSQLESIAALVVGSFVITTAVAIFWDAINAAYDLFAGQADPSGMRVWTLWVALATVVVKTVLTFVTRRIGRRTQNAAVLALAYDHRNDIFSAVGAAIGIALTRMGYPWADPLAGAIVALVVLRTGIHILRDSSSNLMDAVPGETLKQQISGLLQVLPGIRAVEEIQAHHFGPYLVLNITIGIDGRLSVAEGDRIATAVEQTLLAEMDYLRRVYVHYHPAGLASPAPGHGAASVRRGA